MYQWIELWNKEGLNGLKIGYSRRKPRYLKEEEEKQFIEHKILSKILEKLVINGVRGL